MSTANRRRWLCLDCGRDTGVMREHYFVNTELWLAAVGSKVGMLDVSCLEERIGRRLTPADFPAVHINDPRRNDMSELLLSRVRG